MHARRDDDVPTPMHARRDDDVTAGAEQQPAAAYGLEEVGLFLLTARQGVRAMRKPGMVEKSGWIFPRLVEEKPGTGEADSGWGIGEGNLPAASQASEYSGAAAGGGVGKPGVLNRGLRFGNFFFFFFFFFFF
jgi:hypothetical protein